MGYCRSPSIPPLINPNTNEMSVGEKEKADLLNLYFCNISTSLNDGVTPPDLPLRTQHSLDIGEITKDEIKDILKSLEIGSDEYVGCFIDTLTRLLPHEYVLNDESFHSDMENNMCLLHCKELGYIYFGTEAAGFCFCGDDPYWYGPENVTDNYIEDNDCNLKCIGDPEQICGGYWRLSVYRSGYIHFKKGQAQYQLVSNNTMLTGTAQPSHDCKKYNQLCKVLQNI
ncbi:Hypothetical predicted protein [Mytilus galloprovincialis]|uniref:WSC domain-containing protein n=1 Tax=Mytilus galloprovincialis TaxID=29158 RepID=A0A8B6EKI6_MYTGA|nr:Hypothetical predicted protein [Mytilus galloprovincialis]